jgi:integrase
MIQVQLLTGMRPGEVCIMRLCDIDRTSQPWAYRPSHHKTEHFHHERVVFLGPKTQELLLPLFKEQSPETFLFSPIAAVQERLVRQHAARVTPLSCGNVPGSNRKRNPKRRPGDCYCPISYCRAIVRACRMAFPVPGGLSGTEAITWRRQHSWHPHQLRHNAATRLRKQFGLDIAQVILGHKTLAATQIYAERDMESAQKVMAEIG